MKKIAIFIPNLNIGGIARILLAYAKGLSNKGYHVIYLTCNPRGDFSTESFVNIQFVNLGTLRLRNSLFALIKFLHENQPDIIITANQTTLIALLAKWFSRCSARLITSHHNYSNCDTWINNLIVRYIYPFCNNIIAVSEGISFMLTNRFKLNPEKVVTIYNPIDTELVLQSAYSKIYDIPNEYILFVGRLSKSKNLQLLFNAFKIFKQSYPKTELIIIGEDEDRKNGKMKKELETLVFNLKMNTCIHLIGVRPNPFPYIQQAKIVALSSTSEALPTILIEALLLGKTVVSTPTHGAIDILKNGLYGYLSDSLNDINSFANMLKLAYNKPVDKDFVIKAAKGKYDLSSRIMELENLWQN
jgi:glycosyltransferase involved in cell wall biosynthesis